jgi:hypothetical protein
MLLLGLARFLIHHVRFSRWRARLGRPVAAPVAGQAPAGWTEQWLTRVVARGALRLPFETKCLPRAMALHWMLRRRGRESVLAVAVLPGAARAKDLGGLDDLHAWVERGDTILIGASDEPYRVLARFT